MPLSVRGVSTYNFSTSTAVSRNSSVNNQGDTSKASMFDTLKKAFPGVNFVTDRDPLAGKNAKAGKSDTVYLDQDALRKLEDDPKYAAYVFSEVETSMNYAKGYTIRANGSTTIKSPGAQTMSFYGKSETSAGASSTGSFTYTTQSAKTTPTIFSIFRNTSANTSAAINKTYNSFRQLSNDICRTRNETYKKWADKFNVDDRKDYYVDDAEVWKNSGRGLYGSDK